MRYLFTLLVCPAIFSCSPSEPDVEALLDKVYHAHGVEAWDNLETLHYEKESLVYHADQTTKLHTTQRHEYQLRPAFAAEITWLSNDERHQINFKEGRASKTVENTELADSSVLKASAESVQAALYTVSQPFKLRDPGVMLTYEGIDILENDISVYVVKASYNTEHSNHTKNDEWWYYFDVDNYLCRGTMVHHGSTYSYIRNISYDQSTGATLNAHRIGYAVDSNRTILYQQSEYFYRNYEMKLCAGGCCE